MRPDILMNEFGRRIGIEPLNFNEHNEVRLVIGERVIDLFYNKDKKIILFAARIANIIASETSYIFANLLELNLSYALTGGGTVGFDRHENKLHYVNNVSIKGITVDDFENFFSLCVNSMNYLAAAVNSPEFTNKSMSFTGQVAEKSSDIIIPTMKV